uniref:Nuclear pore complex protein Nup88 n=1 Tax=Panagrolaimus superbus TaxID=310955 RepID=A0A914Z1V9_9BILA
MASINDSIVDASITTTKSPINLSSLFVSPKKAIFTSCGSSRLLCFDQVFGYLVNVTKDKQPTYTCSAVFAFTPFPDDGDITDIKVNSDLTKAVLIGKRYVYCFSIPDTRGGNYRTTGSSDLMENKMPVALQTLGSIPNNQNILKVTWLSSNIVRKTYRFSDFIGILYADSTIKVIDVKYPQREHTIDCKSVIHGSIKEDQFKGFGLSKVIVSFDFGPCFVDKSFITIFAIDNESEIYYTSLSALSSCIKVNPIIGPVVFKNGNMNLEPMDITFIKHPHVNSLSLFALALDNGTVSHLLACPVNDWTYMLTGNDCLSFYIQDSVSLHLKTFFHIINDYSTPGEYLVVTPESIYMISTLPWLTEMIRILQQDSYVPKDFSTLACHIFQLVSGNGNFRSAAILADPPVSEDYDRCVFAYDSDGQVHHRIVLKLFQTAPSTSHLIPSKTFTNEAPFITAVPAPADVPKMKNETKFSHEESLHLFSSIFKKLGDLTSNNIQVTNDVIKKSEAISALNDKLIADDELLLKRIVDVADKNRSLQTILPEYSNTSENLIKRCDRVYGNIPREKLTDWHTENETRLYKTKKSIQNALIEARDASMNAILLRSEHVRRQPSFQPSVGAARFMLTKSGISSEELKKEVDKLSEKVAKLSTIAEYSKRMDD